MKETRKHGETRERTSGQRMNKKEGKRGKVDILKKKCWIGGGECEEFKNGQKNRRIHKKGEKTERKDEHAKNMQICQDVQQEEKKRQQMNKSMNKRRT